MRFAAMAFVIRCTLRAVSPELNCCCLNNLSKQPVAASAVGFDL